MVIKASQIAHSHSVCVRGGGVGGGGGYIWFTINPVCSADQASYCANSVDLDETAHNEPFNKDLHCIPYFFFCLTDIPFSNKRQARIH